MDDWHHGWVVASCVRSQDPARDLQPGRQHGALFDRPLGIEFGGRGRASDDMRFDALGPQRVLEVTHGLLAGAYHHIVYLEYARVGPIGPEADVQAEVVNPLVVHTRELLYAFGLQRGSVHPP